MLAAGALFFWCACADAKLSPLAPAPDWSQLDAYQETMTKNEFVNLLDQVYAPGGAWKNTISVGTGEATIQTSPAKPPYILRFAKDSGRRVPAYWKPRSGLGPAEPGKPLAGLKVAIDPGHIGGKWAKTEERWFRIGKSEPVTEGDTTLRVAKLLAARLSALGAQVSLTRPKAAPVTGDRPGELRGAAAASLQQKGEPATKSAVAKESEQLFCRASEIRHRALLVNGRFQPDVVVCLHFNAEDWGNESKPRLVDEDHLHFLVAGNLTADELSFDDQRHDMLVKLLGRSFGEEVALADAMSGPVPRATRLPPYTYHSGNAIRVNGNPYVWGRNLLANRLYSCPVVYIEPYVMNSRGTFARIQAGSYPGTRNIGGAPRKNIYQEYADAVADGLVQYYKSR